MFYIISKTGKMIKIKIGIDIDGVVNNLSSFHITYGTKYALEYMIDYNIDIHKLNSSEIFGWTPEIDELFWNKHYRKLLDNSEFIRPHVSEVTNKIINNGHSIFFISARQDTDLPITEKESMFNITSGYLKDNNIAYSHLFLEPNKIKIINNEQIDIMIEDNPYFFQRYNTILDIPLFCFDNYYNSNITGKNIIRVYSWYDILKRINEIKRG